MPTLRKPPGTEATFVFLFAVALAFLFRPEGRAPRATPTGTTFVISGNELGFIRPCGCSKPALGGVHRRAKMLEMLAAKNQLLIPFSIGELVVEGGRQQQLKFETFLLSLAAMGYQALVPGPSEFLLGVDWLLESRQIAGFPFVLLNVKRGEELLFEKSARLSESGFVVTGLVPSLPQTLNLTVVPPKEALASFLSDLGATDRVFVVWNGPEGELTDLAAAVPEALRPRVILVTGGTSDIPRTLDPLHGVRVLTVGSKGRDLALVRPDDKELVERIRLEEALAGREDVSSMLDTYRQSVKDEKLAEQHSKTPIEGVYVGDQACVECHREICEQLDKTPHERAFTTLELSKDDFDPECVRCHVVGFGEVSGYISPAETPLLKHVTCEACHGPGEAHVESQAKTPNGKLDGKFCVRCHDLDNSPQFDFKTYWPKIAHSSKPR